MTVLEATISNLRLFAQGRTFRTIYADPPWQFQNRTGKVAPEHKRLNRYATMSIADIKALPVGELADTRSHLYLWVPNALLPDGIEVMRAWGFDYKTNLIWEKIRHDGQPDGRGVGSIFAMSPKSCSLAFGALQTGPFLQHARRSISSGRSNANTAANLTRWFP